jgi:hypothetical protein
LDGKILDSNETFLRVYGASRDQALRLIIVEPNKITTLTLRSGS